MQKVIFLKYGELSTKKDNRNFFIKKLNENILSILKDVKIEYDFGRMFIYPSSDNYDEVIEKLQNIFGIHEIVVAYKFPDREVDNIKKNILTLIKDKEFKTFKVEVKRSDKNYPIDGMTLRKDLGAFILKNKENIKVDVNNPEVIINVEIRLHEVLIYMDTIKGLGGYPVGTQGKGLLMLSGGIDSPVAGYLAIKRGIKLEAIYFESPPHTSENALNKVKSLAKILTKYNGELKLHIINFTDIQEEIYKNMPHEYLITIMRRMMYRIGAIIASRRKAKVLINGESIGQVASQTLTSMYVVNEVVRMPVIRPLCCFDKLEIIALSKQIGAYETSILPYEDCCTIFVPDHPVINPELVKAQEYESKIDYEEMIYKAIKSEKVLTIKDKEEEFSDIL